jgi:predicted N-acetyltransferase YhbS
MGTPPAELSTLDIGPYRPGEEHAILDCLRECFGIERDLESWRHVYLANPAGESIIVLARKDGTVVGHTSLVPRPMVAFGRRGVAGHVLWAMTRGEWRGRGLNLKLAAVAEAEARRRGFLALYAFSNDQILHSVLTHQGRSAVAAPPLIVRPLRPVRAALALLGGYSPALRSVAGEGWSVPRFDARHTALFDSTATRPPIAVVRDERYLAWRYPPGEVSPYRQRDGPGVAATIVVRAAAPHGMPFVFVMDWMWRPGAEAEAVRLLRDAIELGRRSGVMGVAALAMPGTVQGRVLRRLGFVRVPRRLLPVPLTLTVRSESPGPWCVPASWHLSFGDTDSV